jgi:hypothetical protein
MKLCLGGLRRSRAARVGSAALFGALLAACGSSQQAPQAGAPPGSPDDIDAARAAERAERDPPAGGEGDSSAAGRDVTTVPPSAGAAAATPSSTTTGAPATDRVGVSASVAMTQTGTLVPEVLVAEVNRQRRSLQRCGPLVRNTDRVVGSLNLQLVVDAQGRVTPDLQSPVNEQARACLVAAARGWRIRGAGHGEAMLLLVLDDAAGP